MACHNQAQQITSHQKPQQEIVRQGRPAQFDSQHQSRSSNVRNHGRILLHQYLQPLFEPLSLGATSREQGVVQQFQRFQGDGA